MEREYEEEENRKKAEKKSKKKGGKAGADEALTETTNLAEKLTLTDAKANDKKGKKKNAPKTVTTKKSLINLDIFYSKFKIFSI